MVETAFSEMVSSAANQLRVRTGLKTFTALLCQTPGVFAWSLLVSFLLLFAAAKSEAATVRAEITSIATRPRTGAPNLVDVKLSLTGAPLVQGRLELKLSRWGAVAAVVRSHELAIPASGLSFRMMLPPLAEEGEITVDARLLTAREIFPAGKSRLWSLSARGQMFLTAVVGSRSAAREGETRLWHELRLERFANPEQARSVDWSTTPAFLQSADLPESPLGWCAFDLVILEGESFVQLRQRQLDALMHWVEAGGSVFIVAAGNISPNHLKVLNRLIPHPPGGKALELDITGKLVPLVPPVVLARVERGRCVLAPAPPPLSAAYAAPEWQEATAFLWKVQSSWFKQLRRGEMRIGRDDGRATSTHEWSRIVALQLQGLLPHAVRMMPASAIATILIAFALTVGPGEWFVLGWLRLRRWTWLVFPLTAAAFTGVTVLAANHYLGRGDHRAIIAVSEIGSGGRVLSQSRLEMFLVGRQQTHREEITRAFQVPTAFGSRLTYAEAQNATAVLYEGQPPLRYTFLQPLEQWRPMVTRSLSFESEPFDDGINWDGVTPRELAAAQKPATLFATQGRTGDSTVYVFNMGRLVEVSPAIQSTTDLIRPLCARENGLIGKMLTSISPSGDAEGADLAIHDAGDAHEWLVVVASQHENTLHLRRRIYRTDE